MDDDTLATLRYCFQRILVPCVVVIGIIGNSISVIVLTRRRMRCSTNIYLTALAVADMVYLLFIFILSLQHYPNINHSKYRFYWSTFGLSHWFCDASAYTSIYLTVSFTIERYIAVCHPIRGQVLCTESRAKKVIAVVVFLCFFLTVSTAFEYKLSQKSVYIDRVTQESCKELTTKLLENKQFASDFSNSSSNTDKGQQIALDYQYYDGLNGTVTNDTRTIQDRNNSCMTIHYIYANQSDFGKNDLYKEIFYILSSIFATFVPLILLATFNCFLVAAVHRSHKIRHRMTNTRQIDTAQENKVTITLIAVVVLFLVCQTPGAIQLIYTMKSTSYTNMDRALNNLCNFLVSLNAACNFLLYCAISDKYRKTVRQLFFGRRPTRTNTISSSRYATGHTTGSSIYSKSSSSARNSKDRTRLKSLRDPATSRFSISPEEYAVFRDEMEKKRVRSQSILATGDRKCSTVNLPMEKLSNNGKNRNSLHEPDGSISNASSSVASSFRNQNILNAANSGNKS